jgi:hypothetical protein
MHGFPSLASSAVRGLCRDRNGGDTRNPVLVRLLAERDEQVRFIEQTLERVETESRDLVDAEQANLRAARERITTLDAQIEPLEEFETLRAAHRSTTSGYSGGGGGGPRPATLTQPRGREYRTAGEVIVERIRAHESRRDAPGARSDADLVVLRGCRGDGADVDPAHSTVAPVAAPAPAGR